MGIFFGTDGIRGVACEELTYDLAYRCGNALASNGCNLKILIGRDTRVSGNYILTAFSLGAMSAGAKIIDVGICSTPAIAYLTKELKMDYGVMISASHNSAEYNGIKIFNSEGYKLGDNKETELERKFINQLVLPFNKVGEMEFMPQLVDVYINHLKKIIKIPLNGLKIVLDASNGAVYKIAPTVFELLGANIVTINCKNDGININNNCGALYTARLCKKVIECSADMGFAFDGDADRIMVVDNSGKVLDGDMILYILAKKFKEENKLNKNQIVGTRHTNMGLEEDLKNNQIKLHRTDIGDKYVIEKMLQEGLSLGGEKSGHIIVSDYATTGDGVLTAILIAELVKKQGKKLSDIANVELYPQVNVDVIVQDKMRVINSEMLANEIDNQEKIIGEGSRIMVRVSGTEPKIRIMVESKNLQSAKLSAKALEDVVSKINGESSCVE